MIIARRLSRQASVPEKALLKSLILLSISKHLGIAASCSLKPKVDIIGKFCTKVLLQLSRKALFKMLYNKLFDAISQTLSETTQTRKYLYLDSRTVHF